MKEKLYIIGTQGSARDVANYVLDTGQYDLSGFVELDEHTRPGQTVTIRNTAYPQISESVFIEQARVQRPNLVVPIGHPAVLATLSARYASICHFPNIIHPTTLLCDTSVAFGQGNIIGPGCVLTTNITLGDFNFLNIGVSIGHDTRLGSHNVLNPKASVSGGVTIGNRNLLGANSSVLQGSTIGDETTVSIGSTLIKDALDGGVYIGVPARRIG